MKHKILTMILLAGLSVSMLTGCGQTETASTADTQTTETTAQPEEPEQAEEVVTETTETEVASEEEPEATTEPSTEEVTPEPTEETTSEYTFTELDKTMYASSAVNLRDLPCTDGAKVGGLNRAEEVKVLAQCNETQWYKISYNGSEVFVSNSYLVDEKPVEEVAQASGSTTSNSCPYTLWQPVDNGDSITWYVTQPDPNWESEHRATQAWMFRTIESRCSQGYWSDQTEWTYIGTYAEGNVYRQTIGIAEYDW